MTFWCAMVAELAFVVCAIPFSDLASPGNSLRLVPLLLGAGVCFLVAFFCFGKAGGASRMAILWSVAVILRVAMLPMAPGDDLSRYAWEGRVQLHGFNPYLLGPTAPQLTGLRDADWEKINHPESAAIYPPATQLVFAAIARVSSAPLAFKIVFALADLLTIHLLLQLGSSTNRALIAAAYAWNPAVAYASAGSAHFDSLMVCTMTAAICALHRSRGSKPSWNAAAASAAWLGVAIAFKLVPAFLLPLWALALRSRSVVLAISVAIPVLLALPFGGVMTVFRPLFAFADVTRFHDLFWWLVEAASMPNPWQRNWPFTAVLAVVVLSLSWKFRDDWRRGALWILGAALVLSPVLHPWYATWLLPLACWRQQPAWTGLSLSALCAFLLWDSTALWTAWQPNAVTRSLVILPPLATCVWLGSRRGSIFSA